MAGFLVSERHIAASGMMIVAELARKQMLVQSEVIVVLEKVL
jgi:hypothetical protein